MDNVTAMWGSTVDHEAKWRVMKDFLKADIETKETYTSYLMN